MVCSSCPYFKVGVAKTVPMGHVTVFYFIPENRWEFCLSWSVNCGRLSSFYNFKCLNDFFSTLIMGNQIFFTVFVCHHVSTVKLRIVFYAVEI